MTAPHMPDPGSGAPSAEHPPVGPASGGTAPFHAAAGTSPADGLAAGSPGGLPLSEAATALLAAVTNAFPAGESRPPQVAMSQAVARALDSRRHLLVQAGTGTGKSLAYLAPLVAAGRKAVVATATKALQDQLRDKDLPLVAAAAPHPVTFAVLKGRSNYLCLQRAAEVDSGMPAGPFGRAGEPAHQVAPQLDLAGASGSGDGGSSGSRDGGGDGDGDGDGGRSGSGSGGAIVDQVRALLAWAEVSRTGERSELAFEPDPRAWAMVSVGWRECPGARQCPSGSTCFAEAARRAAATADVVVVNTHLYGAHLASGGAVLPDHDVVVFDEAHELEEIMTASLGVEISPGRFRALSALARPVLARGAGDDRPEGTGRGAGRGAGRSRSGGPHGADVLGPLGQTADDLSSHLATRVGHRVLALPGAGVPGDTAATHSGVEERGGSGPQEPEGRARSRPGPPADSPGPALQGDPVPQGPTDPLDAELAALVERADGRVEALLARLHAAGPGGGIEGDPSGRSEAFGGARGPQSHPLENRGDPEALSADALARRSRAISAASHLLEDLRRVAGRSLDEVAWVDGTDRAPVLRLSPIDVGPRLAERLWGEVTAVLTSATLPPRSAERLGLGGFGFDTLDVGSPFDYRSHGLLYVARHLPDPRSPAFDAACIDELEALIRAAGGRTLALFTSHRATRLAADALRSRLPYPILAQGDRPKGALLAAFAAQDAACLFATLGFWQGVDVPGPSLSLVTLDRLPFARPDDPLAVARRERAGSDAFRLVDLPRAATLLAQGAGRLIRTATDRGVVAVLDPRLATAGYRHVLLASLPPLRRTSERRQAEDFLARILAPET